MSTEQPVKLQDDVIRQCIATLSRMVCELSGRQKVLIEEALRGLSASVAENEANQAALIRRQEELTTLRRTLEAEHLRYRKLFDFAPDGYLLTNNDGTIWEANRAIADLCQTTQENLVNKAILQWVIPESRAAVQAQISKFQVGQSNRVTDWEFQLLPVNEKPFWASTTVAAIRDAQGDLIGLRWLVRNITRRRQTEEALRQSEERYRRLLTSVTDYFYTVDLKAGQPGATSHGPGCVTVTGYTAEEYTADPQLWIRMVPKGDRKAVLDQADQARAGRSFQAIEHRLIHKDGSIRWVRNTPVPRFDERQRIIAYDGLIADITERKQAMESLRESEEKYRTLIEASTDAIFLESLDGLILDCNSSACKMFGYTKDELHNLTVADLIPGENPQNLPELIAKELKQYGTPIEALNKRKDGQIFPCEVKTLLTTIGGQRQVIVYIRDITERKRADEERLQHLEAEARAKAAESAKAELEKEVADRKQAEEALKQRARQLALINQIGDRIAAVLELDSLLDRAAHLIQESFNYDHVGLFTIDHEQNELVLRARAGSFAHLYPPAHRLKLTQGIVGWVGTHGTKVLANDVRREPRYINLYPEVIRTQSELSVPVRIGDLLLGVLDVQSPDLDAFDENDILVMETLADQIAVALENARLYDAVRLDLVERQRAEAALQESEKRYRTLIDTSPDAIFYTNLELEILLCSQRAAELYGSANPSQMIGMSALNLFPPEERAGMIARIAGLPAGWSTRGQELIMLKQDGARFPVEVNVSLMINETGQPIGLIGVARDLTQRKRVEQYMMRTERLVAMGNITAALAHEIKNPLQAMRSHLELVLDFNLDPTESEEYLRLCADEVDHLTEITERMLSFVRPIEIKKPTPTSVAAVIQRALALVGKPLRRDKPQIKTDLPVDLPFILAMPDQIVQVLLNLVINTIEAIPQGGHINIAAHLEGEQVAITLANDGPPIPAEHLAHLFEPFFTTKPGNTGLGLYISQSIIEQHNGTITVENLPFNQGVIFTVRLPAAGSNPGDTHE